MKKLSGVLVLFAFLFLPVCANATTIDFYTDGTITDGNTYTAANIWDTAVVNMTGGVVNVLSCYDSSQIKLSEGLVSTGLSASDNSIVEMLGGSVNNITLSESAEMRINGGTVYGEVSLLENAVLHIYCKNFTYTSETYGYGYLSGLWADGTSFLISFRFLQTPFLTGRNVVMHIIPEPTTLSIVLLGIVAIRKFRG